MATSRPFDECQNDICNDSRPTAVTGAAWSQAGNPSGDTSVLVSSTHSVSDDDLLDVGVGNDETSGNGGGEPNENIVIALRCLARWHQQHPKPSSDSCDSSIVAEDGFPNSASVDCDVQPGVENAESATDALTQACSEPSVSETSLIGDPTEDGDDRPLLIC